MAFGPGSDAVIMVDDDAGSLTDISAYLSGNSWDTERDTKDLPLLGGNDQAVIVLKPKTSGTWDGYYTGEAAAVFQSFMEDDTPASRTVQIDPQGTTGGLDRYTGEVLFSKFHAETPADDVATFSVDWKVNGGWAKSTI